ncbi:MAG: hypothetical protein E6J03_04350 [Chloroflexi bacterium]|nr:MAG: hypothetical protein E6J03_04350 [Chloroflexota bacterium]
MPDDRPRSRPFTPQRPRPGGAPSFTPRGPGGPPFAPRPGGAPIAPRIGGEQLHSVRLREGDREIEVSGSAAFVRQLLDDLPALLARLRSEGSSKPASISMPPPPPLPAPTVPAPTPDAEENPGPVESAAPATNGHAPIDALTRQVLGILRRTARPMGIAEIRKRISDPVSGQQIRRVLERASEQVVNTGGRPAEYRLR